MFGEEKHIDMPRVWTWIPVTVAVLLAGIWCLLFFVIQIPCLGSGGWRTNPYGQRQYLNYYGIPLKQWQELDGKKYYFHPKTGEMITGWLETEKGTFYFAPSGEQLMGFVEDDEARYYLQDDGKLATGWIDMGEERYYGDKTGRIHTGWQEIDGERYYFAPEGQLCVGWHDIEGYRYLFRDDGSMVTGWLVQNGETYYLDPQTGVYTGWLEEEDKRYYFGSDGARYTGWVILPDGRFYLPEDGSRVEGFVRVDDIDRYFTNDGIYIPLVNKWNSVPEDYVLNLAEVEGNLIDISCKDALVEMLQGCRNAGLECEINSGYRSVDEQQALWESRYADHLAAGKTIDEAEKMTAQEVATPGTSEHHLGLAVDIGGTSKTHRWLEENSWRYGFIRRYPDKKLEITGIIYEPWHYRFVGKTLAKELFEKDLCLEEYLEQLQ